MLRNQTMVETHQHFVAAAQELMRDGSRYCPVRQKWVWRKGNSQWLLNLRIGRDRCDRCKVGKRSRKQRQEQQQLKDVSPQHIPQERSVNNSGWHSTASTALVVLSQTQMYTRRPSARSLLQRRKVNLVCLNAALDCCSKRRVQTSR